ncbi:hypothetical protein WJX84_006450 [Apatococcus fuscideae]|uniref:Uncharacterized protein n=1 Tax=Apatococcus fuscideae TaxID=2026836 RepID=A0AAW1TGR3_9CHLO
MATQRGRILEGDPTRAIDEIKFSRRIEEKRRRQPAPMRLQKRPARTSPAALPDVENVRQGRQPQAQQLEHPLGLNLRRGFRRTTANLPPTVPRPRLLPQGRQTSTQESDDPERTSQVKMVLGTLQSHLQGGKHQPEEAVTRVLVNVV